MGNAETNPELIDREGTERPDPEHVQVIEPRDLRGRVSPCQQAVDVRSPVTADGRCDPKKSRAMSWPPTSASRDRRSGVGGERAGRSASHPWIRG